MNLLDTLDDFIFPDPEELDPALKIFLEAGKIFCKVCDTEMPRSKELFHRKPRVCKACRSAPKKAETQKRKADKKAAQSALRDAARAEVAAVHGVWASRSPYYLEKQLRGKRQSLIRVLRTQLHKKQAVEKTYAREAYYAANPLRTCLACGVPKPLSAYPIHPKSCRPYGNYCCPCSRRRSAVAQTERARAYRLANPLPPKPIKPSKPPYVPPRLPEEERIRRAKESKKRSKQKARQDVMHRINRNFSEQIRRQFRHMRSGKTCGGWKQHVGYTLFDLKRHLEAQFQPGMTWDNYGEWHIDHKKPKASFSFASPDDPQFLECWGLENLQPLWGQENSKKGSKLPPTGHRKTARELVVELDLLLGV